MSRYKLTDTLSGAFAITEVSGDEAKFVATLVPQSKAEVMNTFVVELHRLLSAPAQFDIGQRLITEEEFRQALGLREDRLRIQRVMELVAVNKGLTVVIGANDHPELSQSATRGVLNQLMDDFAHNGNAIRKLGFEPAAIEKSIAEAVEAVLAVFLEAGATE